MQEEPGVLEVMVFILVAAFGYAPFGYGYISLTDERIGIGLLMIAASVAIRVVGARFTTTEGIRIAHVGLVVMQAIAVMFAPVGGIGPVWLAVVTVLLHIPLFVLVAAQFEDLLS